MKDKKALKEELYHLLEISIAGINYEKDTFKDLLIRHPEHQMLHLCMDPSKDDSSSYYIPDQFYSPNGFQVTPSLNKKGLYQFEVEGEQVYITKNGERIIPLTLWERPAYLDKTTSDGIYMKTIAQDTGNPRHGRKNLGVAYSNECALRDKGLDCLFCNINATRAKYAEKENIQWKTPRQIAETVKAAYEEGYDHFTVTGGFVPERREVEYYLDVAEAIQEELEREEFNGTACIGAPKDLTVIEKYKEAGWSTLGLNLEVWTEAYFNAICPGKVQECGGYQHWLDALKYAIEVFGKGNVRCNFVAGLTPKDYLLDGIDTLSSWGIVATASPWGPNAGSKLEGHQTPTAEWHWDVQNKIVNILRKNGITYNDLYYASNGHWILHELFGIEEGIEWVTE